MLWEDESKSKVTLSDCQLKQGISKQNMLFLQYFSKNWSTKIVSYYHGPPKPTFLEVSMVNDLVFKWPKPLFFMVLGVHGKGGTSKLVIFCSAHRPFFGGSNNFDQVFWVVVSLFLLIFTRK